MQIQSFAECTPAVWAKIKIPWIAIYERDETAEQTRYLAKVYDADNYTRIFLQGDNLNDIRRDIEKYSPFVYAKPGAEDDPQLVCAYVNALPWSR